ncbi:hypothetical protein [Leptolyngbya sp. 7M]|uniref:hypothetical protein n=1 Tax=Leptolyngbya sp. 7M TaxID=2812896 RepID=UPI0021F10A9E|nr:hypothetical protein [Leptolyngbya sp. 7M]
METIRDLQFSKLAVGFDGRDIDQMNLVALQAVRSTIRNGKAIDDFTAIDKENFKILQQAAYNL